MTKAAHICKIFNRIAKTYDGNAVISKEVGLRLFERLEYLKIAPKYILDLGCGTGQFIPQLQKKYPKAIVVGLDIAQNMLDIAKKKHKIFQKNNLVLADMVQLPFATGCFDLVFSNQAIHYTAQSKALLREINRVMAFNGCFMFSTLGPDTGIEIEKAWGESSTFSHRNVYIDMHDWGDFLMHEHFKDPVVDMEYLTLETSTLEGLLTYIKQEGNTLTHPQRYKGLTTLIQWQAFIEGFNALKTKNDKYPLTFEVIYGHAFKGDKHKLDKGHEVYFSIEGLKHKNKAS